MANQLPRDGVLIVVDFGREANLHRGQPLEQNRYSIGTRESHHLEDDRVEDVLRHRVRPAPRRPPG